MSLILSSDHPAIPILRGEGIGVAVPAAGAGAQEGQLRIAVLNVMPDKQATELDLLRVLGRSRHAVEPVWIMTSTYRPRNADPAHLGRFYKTFGKVRMERFHGMIITGAPVEHLEFEEVLYWQELKEVMDWANANVANTLFICWAAQAALYHHYGIGKFPLEEKLFGVFDHRRDPAAHPLLDGIGAVFPVPHSRYTTIRKEDVEGRDGLNITSNVKVDMVDAVLGTTVDVQTMDGVVSVKVPPGTQPGQKLRLKGRGIKGHDGRRGDHLAAVRVVIPKKVSKRQKELLREFSEA